VDTLEEVRDRPARSVPPSRTWPRSGGRRHGPGRGGPEDIEESLRNLILSIGVALGLVYLILAIFFGTVVAPLIIPTSVTLLVVPGSYSLIRGRRKRKG